MTALSRSVLTIAFLIPLPPAVARAQSPPAQAVAPPAPGAEVRLMLADAVSRAIETSHRLAEARARQEGAEATVRVRQAADQPTVSVSGGYSRTNHVDVFGIPQPDGNLRVVYPDVPDNYRARVEMQWPIYTGGRADALERAARAEAGATGLDLRAAQADLRLEVVRAYWALVTANDAVRVLDEALTRAEAHLRDVRSQFDVGLIPPNDVLSVEAQRSREEMQLIEARNQREGSLTDLRRLTGLAPDASIVPVENLEAPTPTQSVTQPRWWPKRSRRGQSDGRWSSGLVEHRTASARRVRAGCRAWRSWPVWTTRTQTLASSRARTCGTTRGTLAST